MNFSFLAPAPQKTSLTIYCASKKHPSVGKLATKIVLAEILSTEREQQVDQIEKFQDFKLSSTTEVELY